ncbi:hypothetical protein WKS98_09750 [Lagierella sp. ICN-221743]
MLDTIQNNQKRIIKIYKGNEKIWEMPIVFLKIDEDIRSGYRSLSGLVYPTESQIIINYYKSDGKEEILKTTPTAIGKFIVTFDEDLKIGDSLDIFVESAGWRRASRYIPIRF